jgi:predicted transcriptional regulator
MAQVRRQLLVSVEMDQRVNQLAQESETTSAEIVWKALNLYLIAVEKQKAGLKLGFSKQADRFETEVVGL